MQAPYKPEPGENKFDMLPRRIDDEMNKSDLMVLKQKSIQDLFGGYFYDISKSTETAPTSQQSSFIAASNNA